MRLGPVGLSTRVSPRERHPDRVIVASAALTGSAVGIATGDFRLFALAVVLCATLLCAGYTVIRRRHGWQPLRFDDLVERVRVLFPA